MLLKKFETFQTIGAKEQEEQENTKMLKREQLELALKNRALCT